MSGNRFIYSESNPHPDLQRRIDILGRNLFAQVDHQTSDKSPRHWFEQHLMKLTTRNPILKTQLFRFTDVLPSLFSPQQVTGHLQQYLQTQSNYLPPVLRLLVNRIPRHGLPANLLAAATRFGAQQMATKFIAATNECEATAAILKLRDQGLAFTIDLLGEAVVSDPEAQQYQQQYLSLLQHLSHQLAHLPPNPILDRDSTGPIPSLNLSLKLSSLYSQFDPIDPQGTAAVILNRLRPIFRLARRLGAFINLDMEQFAFKDLTLHIFKTILTENEFRDWPHIGIALQAYLRCTLADLNDLAQWVQQRRTPTWVRLVKGAYWDFETITAAQNNWPAPVFLDKNQTDANFETCTAFLMQHARHLRPAIATHNIRTIAAALALAEKHDLHPLDVEFQMLFGMADPIKKALVQQGRRVRVYTPFGQLLPGMAYLVRRLLENTSNESFLRAGFIEHLPQEQLLMNPLSKIRSPKIKTVCTAPPAQPPFTNEPPTDFSLATAREAMTAAVAALPKSKLEFPIIIAGRRVTTERWIESINPSHKAQIVGRVAQATPELAADAVAAARAAFPSWRDAPAQHRCALLERVGKILQRDRFSLAALEIAECGKPWRDADADVAEAIDFCFYYAQQMRRLARPTARDFPGEQNRWLYEPRGVCVVIAPWNFPLAILTGMTTAAFVTGNTVIMKPAEQSPLIAARLAAAFEEAGAPPGVVNFLPGIGEEIGPVLVQHPDVAMIAFTGSRSVGLGINALASHTPPDQDHVKRIITEMGGKNAIIVDEDADLDEAVIGTLASAFGYSGQKCSAASRVIVLAGAHDAFERRLIEATASLKIAPAEDPACRVGPVIDAQAFEKILAAIESGKTQARLAYAGDPASLAAEGFYIAPHIFADVPPRCALAQEEIFGPVLSLFKVQTLDQALQLANGVQYALTGGLYSRSPANIDRCRREFRVGNLYINRKITGALVGRQPFGGFKLSGGGTQAGGPDYLQHFLLPRCISENTLRHGFSPEIPADSG